MINKFMKTIKDDPTLTAIGGRGEGFKNLTKDEIERFSKTVQKTNKYFVPKDDIKNLK